MPLNLVEIYKLRFGMPESSGILFLFTLELGHQALAAVGRSGASSFGIIGGSVGIATRR